MLDVTTDPHSGGSASPAPSAHVPAVSQVVLFYAISFAVTWATLLPLALRLVRIDSDEGKLLTLGLAAPTLTAIVLTALSAGWDGVRQFWRQGRRWRVGVGWYALVLIGPALVYGAGIAVAAALGTPVPVPDPSIWASAGWVAAVVSGVIAGLAEEFGWSGFAFPGLQARFGLFTAGAMVGALLAMWHLPLFFIPGLPHAAGSFPLFLVAGVPLRIVFGWIYNGTGGSILLMILFHGALNAWADILSLPTAQAEPTWLVFVAILWVVVVILRRTERGGAPRPELA